MIPMIIARKITAKMRTLFRNFPDSLRDFFCIRTQLSCFVQLTKVWNYVLRSSPRRTAAGRTNRGIRLIDRIKLPIVAVGNDIETNTKRKGSPVNPYGEEFNRNAANTTKARYQSFGFSINRADRKSAKGRITQTYG